jgi:hypothetical protein
LEEELKNNRPMPVEQLDKAFENIKKNALQIWSKDRFLLSEQYKAQEALEGATNISRRSPL